VAFLVCTVLSILLAIINMVVFIIHQSQSVNQTVVIVIVAIVGSILGVPLIGFCIFHMFLAINHSTTRECVKKLQNTTSANV
jgi:hypothetical protein